MFRSKKEVEKHVLDVLSKIDSENEKNLRGYAFARLYFQVRDYDSARKYLLGFLSIRDHHAPAHKLMAQIYEATNNPESALQSFKRSLEIDSSQNDIILKICELYCQLPVDHETAKYWADRAEQIYPHNEIVFKLRECLVSAEGDTNHEELENLIASELAGQPKNVGLRIKLLRLYLDTERVKEAYEHATLIESKQLFPSSDDWYYTLADIFEAYQEEFPQDLDSQFYIHYLTALDHLIYLNLCEPHSRKNGNKSHSINDAADVIFSFDKYLKKASEKDIKEGSWVYFLHHMKGQLFYHMASILLKKAKLDQGNRKEALRFSSGLALVCYTVKPINLLQEIWFSEMNENQKVFTSFFQQGSLRTAFIGRVIQCVCKDEKSKWLQRIKTDVCISQVKERIFNRIFSSVRHKKNLLASYFFMDDIFENSSLEFPTDNALKEYDKSAYKLSSSSLHHLVWLEFHQRDRSRQFSDTYLSEIFKGLQYNNKNLSKGSCESLCILDLEAYLCASVYQTEADIEKKKSLLSNWIQDLHFSCPPDVADAMCSKQQSEWWRSVHGLQTCTIKEKLGEHRRILQHGLEVIRGVGNHGMDVQLVVHLARLFADKAEFLLKDKENSNENKKKILPENIAALQLRATHYWNIALGMLEKLSLNVSVKIPKERMFTGFDKTLSKNEIRTIQEDGQLYIAVQLMESEKLNEAAEILSTLSSPYGSFYLALTLKRFGVQEDCPDKRSMFLTKAQRAIHDTMDRIKDDKSHPLNRDIHIILEDIENELGIVNSTCNGNNEDTDEVDLYEASPGLSNSMYATPMSFKSNLHSTPKPSSKFMSTKSKLQYSNEDYPKHFEPSPERLDAQIRSLALNQETVMKTIMEQNKSFLETNKIIVETLQRNNEVLTELKKQLEELKLSDSKNPSKSSDKKQYLKAQGDYENFDPSSLLEYYEENEDYRASTYNYNQSSRIVQDAAASLNYVVNTALPPGPPPQLNHYNYQYAPHAVLPAAPVPERPQFYPPSGQSLPFSEGQQLPQFHFHVASPVVKPQTSIISHVSSIPQSVTLPPPPPSINLHQPPPVCPTSSVGLPITGPWTKPVGVPHAFQIPLPPPPSYVSSPNIIPQSIAPVSTGSMTSQSTLKNLLSTPTSNAVSIGQTLQYSSSASISTPQPLSIFSGISKTPEHLNAERSRCDSDNAGSPEIDGHDIEKEVMGDFKPLIPLPAEVVVETGEEDEMALFEDKAKLYRFVDQEWKERGTGIVKILYHDGSKRVRLLMRRDQVYKVCANHYITSNMEVKPLKSSDRAWTWVAQDFADEELRPEQFCIRFKTPEVALNFKAAFERAINIAKENESKEVSSPHQSVIVSSSNSQIGFPSKFLPKSGSWNCPTCYMNNAADKLFCVACETKKPDFTSAVTSSNTVISSSSTLVSSTPSFGANLGFKTPTSNTSQFSFGTQFSTQTANKSSTESLDKSNNTPKSVFGGFTFSTAPTILETPDPDSKDREILVVSTKSKNGPQVSKVSATKTSPFSGFTFTSPTSTNKPSTFFQSSDSSIKIAPVSEAKSTHEQIPFSGFTFQPFSASNAANQSSDSSIKIASVSEAKSTHEQIPFSGFTFQPFSASNATNQSSKESFVKDTDSSKSSQFSSGTILKQPLFSTDSTSSSTESSDLVGESNLSKIQSMVQNLKPTFVFNSNESTVSNITPFTNLSSSSEKKISSSFSPIATDQIKSCDGAPEDFIPTAEFKPVVPLPALVDVKTGEENEEKKFCERAKLFRYDSETKEWKERGTGELKILYLKESQKYRILMRRDQVLKICANHYILPEMKLTPLATSDRSWVWFAQDFSDGDLVQEKFAAKFKTSEIATQFFNVFEKCRTELQQMEKEKPEVDLCQGNKDSFEKLFTPSLNSWQCANCNHYNSNQSSCIYCKTPIKHIVSEADSTQTADLKPLSEIFKPTIDSWECSTCYVRNKSSESKCVSCSSVKPDTTTTQQIPSSTASDKSVSLSEMFKSKPGSWVCEVCMVNNGPEVNTCVACETIKPGSTDVPTSNKTNDVLNKFQFNPLSSNSQTSTFSFGSPKTASGNGFVFGSKPIIQPSTFTFGQSALSKSDQVTGFKPSLPASDNAPAVFGGMTQQSTTKEQTNFSIPPVTAAPTYVFGAGATTNFNFNSFSSPKKSDPESVEFRFGSPQKYEFNFSGVRPRSPTKTPKSPRSPATPSDVDDDEVVSSDADNIYFTPVIPLPPKVDVKTGEENESVSFCKRAKLFRFVDGEWKERGIGDLKILLDNKSKKMRLLMRREQVLKVCLNHYLTKEIKFEWRGDKSLTWAATDFSENEATPELFAVRFKTAEQAQEFKKAVDVALINAISDQKNSDNVSDKLKSFSFKLEMSSKIESNFSSGSLSSQFGITPQEKPIFGNTAPSKVSTEDTDKTSAFSFSLKKPTASSFFGQTFGNIDTKPIFGGDAFKSVFKSSDEDSEQKKTDDVEIMYEALPTPEKIAAAEKLMLPRTFYLYENKEPCPGCRGCSDTIPPLKGNVSDNEEKDLKTEGSATSSEAPAANSENKPFFSNFNSVTFTDLAAKSSFPTPPQSSSKFVFAGAGTPIFANVTPSTDDTNDDTVVENPDVHFEPVIPLPDLVEVKTGEEDETPIFVHRAKLFRFDGSTKQWKERGIGDIKILSHKEKTRFRILLRRDQVHNIACNHCITEDMSLSPLTTSDNAVCWNAIDNSDGEAMPSKFAVRFKNLEKLEEFKAVFNQCVEKLKEIPNISTKIESPSNVSNTTENAELSNSHPNEDNPTSSIVEQQITKNNALEDTNIEEQNLDEESDEDEIIFEKRVSFEIFDVEANQFKNAGIGDLKITYDDSVYGYRITMTNDQKELICDHIIAIQNCIRVEGKKAVWAAIDMCVQPPKRRQFRASFSSNEAVKEFHKLFEEGKETALFCGIVEEEDYQGGQ